MVCVGSDATQFILARARSNIVNRNFTWHMVDYWLSLRDILRVSLESLVVHVWFMGSIFLQMSIRGRYYSSLVLLLGAICYLIRIFNDEWASPFAQVFLLFLSMNMGVLMGTMRSPFSLNNRSRTGLLIALDIHR